MEKSERSSSPQNKSENSRREKFARGLWIVEELRHKSWPHLASIFRTIFHSKGKNGKGIPVQDSGFVPLSEQGILMEVILHVMRNAQALRGINLPSDAPYIYVDEVLKSTLCIRDFCYARWKGMTDPPKVEIEVSTSAPVIDLLLAATFFAFDHVITYTQSEVFLYPRISHPTQPNTLAFYPNNLRNLKKIIRTLCRIPSPKKMAQCSSMEIKRHLENKDPLAYPLLKWVIESVTIPIVKLPINQKLGFMRTRNQFLFLTALSERDAEFCSARRMYGSAFAFHGSKVWNWHSIIHQGLLNFSCTNREVFDGALYGKGIHTSPRYNIACEYSDIPVRRHNVEPKRSKYENDQLFMKGQEIKCVALCEVIKSPSLKKHGGTWVISNPAHICIRFLFVYEDNNTPYDVHTEEPKIKNAILHSMARYIPLDELAS
uniref:protein mono-ADP-ribosyltransferase PARP6-like isoform X2 n=1 Tax=Myxine glutinosa TaxID=7769 RepID=UPI00358E7B3F